MTSPQSGQNELARGVACFRQGRVAEALECFRKVASQSPASFAAHANLGNVYMHMHRYEDAIEAFRQALRINESAPLVAHNLGSCYEQTNRLGEAERFYECAIRIRPDYAEALVDLGNVRQKLGNNEAAMACYRKALELDPGLASAQHNVGLCLYDDADLGKAEDAFRKALDMDAENALAASFLAIILEHQGRLDEARPHVDQACRKSEFSSCLIESARYALECGGDARFFSNTADLLRHAVREAPREGLYLELGVYYGSSLDIIADSAPGMVHGFDSFEGLPESWFVGSEKGPLAVEPSGAYTTKGVLPNQRENAAIHVGWFEETLPAFLDRHAGDVAFMNVDCDIYSSTRTIFENLSERLRPGSIIVFDEYFCYPEWRQHEYKAFQEYIASSPYSYEYIAFSYFTGQAAVRIVADR